MFFIAISTLESRLVYTCDTPHRMSEDSSKALLFPTWEEAERVRQQLPSTWDTTVLGRHLGPDRFQRVLSEDLLFLDF